MLHLLDKRDNKIQVIKRHPRKTSGLLWKRMPLDLVPLYCPKLRHYCRKEKVLNIYAMSISVNLTEPTLSESEIQIALSRSDCCI